MKKLVKPAVGDEIITNKKFEMGEKMEGVIRDILDENIYAVEFELAKKGMHKFDNLLTEANGFCIEEKEFKIVNHYQNSNKIKEKFVNLIRTQYFKKLLKIPARLQQVDKDIKQRKRDINSYANSLKNTKTLITKFEKEKISISQQLETLPDNAQFEKQFNKLTSHPLIKKIELIEEYLIVTTKDLTYHDGRERNKLPDFNIGAFMIFIPLDESQQINTINYKRQVLRGNYFHPCIRGGGSMCLGDNVAEGVKRYRQKSQYIELIYLLINFLQEPDYHGPHIKAHLFYCAQPVTIKPTKIFDWLDNSYWNSKEKFDDPKYRKDINNIQTKYKINNSNS